MGARIPRRDSHGMPTAVATRKVFLVDDSQPIRTRLAEMLERLDAVRVVGEADSPDEAIAGILASEPDVVLLDLHLRGGSGLTVLRTVHARAPQVVFVVLTNHPTQQHRKLCLDAGARHFLDKSNEFSRVNEIVAGVDAAGAATTFQSQ
jgi:DNA-binding NarL/FixJ family response regulator